MNANMETIKDREWNLKFRFPSLERSASFQDLDSVVLFAAQVCYAMQRKFVTRHSANMPRPLPPKPVTRTIFILDNKF